MDATITFYFKPDGSYWCNTNGKEVQLHGWLGEQMRAFNEVPQNWHRDDITKYEHNDLEQYLRKIGESKPGLKPKGVNG